MSRRSIIRPSLRVTRHLASLGPDSFQYEVWNPFTQRYQPLASISEALPRLEQLARLICQMSIQRHPKLPDLIDIPDPLPFAESQWAELRTNPTVYRSYDTRHFSRLAWIRRTGLSQALAMTCAAVQHPWPAASAAQGDAGDREDALHAAGRTA